MRTPRPSPPRPPRCAAARSLAAAALAAALAAGCAALEREPPESAEARRAYQAAQALLDVDRAGGVAALEAFVRERPRSRLADDAALDLARLALEDGDRDRAISRLRWLIQAHPSGDRVDEARVLLGRAELARGNPEAARRALGRLRLMRLPDPMRHRALRLSADIAAAEGDRVAAVRWLARLRELVEGSDERALLDVEIDALVDSLDARELERAAAQIRERPPAARLQLRRAELALAAGDAESAGRALSAVRELPLEEHEVLRLARLEERLASGAGLALEPGPSTAGASGTLGVVVPLSGPFARFGEEALRGVLLAAGIFDEASPRSTGAVRVLVRDTGGSPEGAAEAVRSLAADPRVSAIVGPLLSKESQAAARAAQEAGVPLLALTRREEVARERPYVFRLGITHSAQAERLAEYAIEALGARRFAILYPDDPYGRGAKNLFWDAVEARGGEVTGVASYAPGDPDVADAIRSLIGFRLLSREEAKAVAERDKLLRRAKRLPPQEAALVVEEAREMRGPKGEPLPPIVDFEVLFLPDSHAKGALIAAQLAFHEVTPVRIFAPAGWHHEDLLRIGGRHVEGAVFAEAFYPDPRRPHVAEFARRYAETFGSEPGEQAAAAFDAANLVLLQFVRGRDARERLREGVLATRVYPGVAGVTTILTDGNVRKRPYLVGVESGSFVALDGRPPKRIDVATPADGGPEDARVSVE